MTVQYDDADLKRIAQISHNKHVWLLTDCGLCPADAEKLIAMPTATLATGIAATESRPNQTDAQKALIAAGRRELIIRG